MKQILLGAVLAVAWGGACAQEDTKLYYKVFSLQPNLWERMSDDCDREHESGVSNADWRKFLSRDTGATWPAGSEAITSLDDSTHLIVRNTRANLSLIDRLFSSLICASRKQVVIEFSIVSFRAEDIDRLQMGEGVSIESLTKLRKEGHSELVTTARVVTKSGQEAIAKDVQEITCPTEMSYGFGTNQVGNSSWAVIPSAFEMREVGTILQVLPELFESGQTINLALNPQWVTLNRWEVFESGAGSRGDNKKVPLRVPVFDNSAVQTQFTMKNGETVLLGGGKKMDENRVQYQFIRAEAVGIKESK